MKRIAGILGSITFKLALTYTLIFGVSVAALFYFVYLSTTSFVVQQKEAAIDADVTGFQETFERSGVTGLIIAINRRTNNNRDGIYLLAGPGGNVTAHISDDGVLLVDTGDSANVGKLSAALAKLSDRPVSTIINTSVDELHSGGNEPLSQTGRDRGVNAPGNSGFRIGVAPIIAHEGVMRRMSAPTGEQSTRVFAAWPTSTYFTDKKTMFFGDDPVEVYAHQGYTDGDSIVFFRRSDVISAGDLFMTDRYPVIDVARGGRVQGVLDGLNRIIDLAIPRFNQQGGTLVIPGHGRIGNESDVVEYRDMLTIVRDRIRRMIAARLTLEQVKAARPTLDYDGVYGASSGPWTTEMFVEAVYRDLSRR